jgi:hypothetical protein
MDQVISVIADNWEYIVAALFGLLAVAKLVTKFTKTKKDDEVVEQIEDVVEDVLKKDKK